MTTVIYDKNQLLEACSPFEFINDKGKDETVVEELTKTVSSLKEVLNDNSNLLAISAPQIGIKRRVFCIRFADDIKTFINPIIKSRSEDKFINHESFVDGNSHVYICRPKEIEITYLTDSFKVEDNKLLDQAAAIFVQQYNLLDGIVPGVILDNFETVTSANLLQFIEATYSGSGIVLDKAENIPDLNELAEVLSKLALSAQAKLKDIVTNNSDEDLRKLTKRFLFEENIILGRTKVVDQENWNHEKKIINQAKLNEKQTKKAQYKHFVSSKKH